MTEKAKFADTYMPDEKTFKSQLSVRHTRGTVWQIFYMMSIFVAILALIVLFLNVIDSAFGSIATTFEVDAVELTGEGRTLEDLSKEELMAIISERIGNRLLVIVRDRLSQVSNELFTGATLAEVVPNGDYPDGFEDTTINEIRELENTNDILAEFARLNLSKSQIIDVIESDIMNLQVVEAWSLYDALFNFEPTANEQARLDALPQAISDVEAEIARVDSEIADLDSEIQTLRDSGASDNADAISALNAEVSALQQTRMELNDELDNLIEEQSNLINGNITVDVATNYPDAELVRFHSWVDSEFLTDPMSSVPAQAGIRTAFIGSMMMMAIVILVSLPIGVGTAIYLEEYAQDNFLAQIPDRVDSALSSMGVPDGIKRRIVGLTNINKLIETNVRNLAGVPSIIYGMLGLAIFVRVLAPFTSGIVFGVNAAPPSETRIVTLMEEPASLGIDIELDDNYTITEFSGPEFMSEAQAQELVALFRRSGTPSVSNRGGMTLEESEILIGEIFDIEFLDEFPAGTEDEVDFVRVDAGVVEVATLPMTIEQLEDLAQQLRRVTSFTISGRTIISGALTLSLLILPVIIINSQEALRSVGKEIREASYGLGATKWQTIWRTVLPASVPGIMTGTILAVSRAVGETAPLIVVGASTFLLTDPSGPFSQFTVLPIQIYQWSARPQGQFEFIAAAAIIVLLSLVLVLNAIAIIIRNRFSTRN